MGAPATEIAIEAMTRTICPSILAVYYEIYRKVGYLDG